VARSLRTQNIRTRHLSLPSSKSTRSKEFKAQPERLGLSTNHLRRRNKRFHKLLRIAETLRKPNLQRPRRRHSLASFLIIRDQLTVPTITAISSKEERVRHAFRGVDVRTVTAVRFGSGFVDSHELGVAWAAQECMLEEALACETEGEFVGDEVDD
jgi:hypothetical protein